jgi:hypothetical protein
LGIGSLDMNWCSSWAGFHPCATTNRAKILKMQAAFLARMMVTALAAGQGLAPLFIDLNRTHATHPRWPRHARFHVVWQTFTATFGAAATVALIWWAGPGESRRFYFAAILTAIPLGGFLVALCSRRLYGGALHDPDGILPIHIRAAGKLFEIDLNAVIVAFAWILLVIAVAIF